MVSLQSCSILNSLSSSSSSKITITNAVSSGPKYLRNSRFTVTKKSNQAQKHLFIDEFHNLTNFPLKETQQMNLRHEVESKNDVTLMKLYAVLEAVNDRIEMHQNVCEQRENWNSLLLNSINMITLTAVTMSGLAEAASGSVGPLKVSASVLFAAGTGLLLIMNRVQPCQLVEEQRNAVRLLKQVQNTIQTVISTRKPMQTDVEEAMEKVLALDRAYPLPLIGAMLEKFPERLEPAVWWPCQKQQSDASLHYCSSDSDSSNGWSQELEDEMREIIGVTKRKDVEDYVKLGNKALKLNKILAVSGPILTGVAAVGAACGGHGSWGGVVAAAAGSMAAAVNTLEHGGQVGMVFEMYRNCAGFFRLLEETVESTLDEGDLRKRENGEVFEMKMALHLGRSLSELRNLADKSSRNGGYVDEFASKLF